MDPSMAFIFAALLSFLIFPFTVWIIYKKFWSNLNLPPGPTKLPIIGNLHQLVGSLPHRRLADLAKTYGPFMHLQLGQVSTLIISSPDAAKQVMKTYDLNFSDRSRGLAADILFYNCNDIGFAPYGEYWRKMRKICTVEVLSSKRVQGLRSIREEEVWNCIRSINSKVGSAINASDVIFCMTNSMVARTLIGRKSKNQEAFLPLVDRVLNAIKGFSVADVFPSLEFIHIISGTKSRLHKLHKQVDEVFDKLINERISTTADNSEANSLLDVLLNLRGNLDFPLTTDNTKAVILDMFLGGVETSATTLEWAMSEIMKNPIVMVKAQEEVRRIYNENGKIDETMIHELKFLRSVIKETLRLHPPATLIPRKCRQECKIKGYDDVKVGTEVLINLWAIGRDPNYWIEAEKFNPERFLDSPIDYKGFDFEFIPFGGGRRMCPGMLLGIADMELPLAQLLCHFDWKLPNNMKPEDLDMTEAFSLATRRKNDLYLIPLSHHHSMLMD